MPELVDGFVAAVSGIYALAGGLALVTVCLAVDHYFFRRRNDEAIADMRAAESPRAPRFDVEVDDDWGGFPA